MRNSLIVFTCLFALLINSCTKKQQEHSLITNFNLKGEAAKNMDELFGKNAKLTLLETTDESLVGKIGKIIKRQKFFFILSEENQILQFNDEGQFISTLNKLGSGPDEYTMITDFSIYIKKNNEIEIWISDFNKIKKYYYTNKAWVQFDTINYPYVINKFYVVNSDCLLLLTGQNDNSLTVSDGKGKIISSYLKSEIPFLIFKPVQFVDFGDNIIFQKGVSNSCVSYSIKDNNFEDYKIVGDNSFISSNMLLELFTKYEYDYLKELSGYSYIRTLRQIKEQTLIEFFKNKKRYVYHYSENTGWRYLMYNPENILNNNEFECLSTIGIGDGLTSFILFQNNKNEDENPIIIEY